MLVKYVIKMIFIYHIIKKNHLSYLSISIIYLKKLAWATSFEDRESSPKTAPVSGR